MGNRETVIQWFNQRVGKVAYSQGARLGPNSFDCSSAVHFALIAGGFIPPGTFIGNTDSLFGTLEAHGWNQVARNQVVRGDVFIWGVRGRSGGNAGHTGVFVENGWVIDCHGGGGITGVRNYDQTYSFMGGTPAAYYHHPSSSGKEPPKPVRTLTPQEKVAWNIWQVLSKKGYSKQSVAGILGNVEAECSMNPDTDQIGGGGGYGLVQWTSPNLGEAGRAYVQRLLKDAGIQGDYRNEVTQAQLIDHGMYHGQWIGRVVPTSPDEFKKTTDTNNAVFAFLKNFERAGVERLSVRQAGARRWLEFLSTYNPEDPNGEIKPEPKKETLKNAGELESIGIKNGKCFIKGWHFSSNKPKETIVVCNATNDKEILRQEVQLKKREDIKKKYPKVDDVEMCGFELEFALKSLDVIYIKGIRANAYESDTLIFPSVLSFEPATNVPVDHFADKNEKFFFEILDKNTVIYRGNKILNTLSWTNELMDVPTTEIVLPIELLHYFEGRKQMKLYINHKVFHGIAETHDADKKKERFSVKLNHIIKEFSFRQISTNLACKNRTMNDIYSTLDFRYSNEWHFDYLQRSALKVIDYVYSRQNKLDGLTKTCELTDDIFWRVGFNFGRKLEFGSFGDKKEYVLSTHSEAPIRIIEEPTITHDYSNVVNALTVYGEKSDSGMSSMSLRDVYVDTLAQKKGFPIKVIRHGINNERGYDYMNLSKIASNNDVEYTVIDEESVAVESHTVIEETATFNDLAPFAIDSEKISDEDRAKATRGAYEATIKRLIQNRRKYQMNVKTTELPNDVNVGDRIRLACDNSLLISDDCTPEMKRILQEDDWFYITKIAYDFDKNGVETNGVTLEKWLRIDREQVKR